MNLRKMEFISYIYILLARLYASHHGVGISVHIAQNVKVFG